MNSSRRVVLNTLATYGRSLLGLVLGLLSGRWVLEGLGVDDFGYFSVVGGLLFFVTFIGDSLGSVAARQFAYALGEGDAGKIQNWFRVSFQFNLLLPALLVAVFWPIGEWCLHHVLVIAPERLNSCLWVFRFSLISAFSTVVAVPFSAMYYAKQHIALLSAISLIRTISLFILGLALLYVQGDRLVFYAVCMTSITVLLCLTQIGVAIRQFPECKLSLKILPGYYYQTLLGLSFWQLVGNFGFAIREQGLVILVNRYLGSSMNAAVGIGKTLAMQSATLSAALQSSLAPALTQETGAGNERQAMRMSIAMSKYSTLLIALFAVPLFFEIETVLNIWLVKPPEHSAFLCRWILFVMVAEKTTIGSYAAVFASGKIRLYEILAFVSMSLAVPIMIGLSWIGYGLDAYIIAFVISSALTAYAGLFCAWLQKQTSQSTWLSTVFVPCLLVIATSSLAALMVTRFLPATWWRVPMTTAASLAVFTATFFGLACTQEERGFFRRKTKGLWFSIKSRMGRG